MNALKKISWPFWLLIALWLPAVWYSVQTPYALVDDYTDWNYLRSFDSWDRFYSLIRQSFLDIQPGARYRPFMDFIVALFWKISKTNYGLHHFLRLCLKSASIVSLYYALKQIAEFLDLSKNKILEKIILFGCVFSFSFFPNCPEARLTPQELNVCFFTCLFYLGMVFMVTRGRSLETISLSHFLFIACAHFGVSTSKETAVGIVLAQGIALAFCLGKVGKKSLLRYFWICLITFYTVARVAYAASSGVERQPHPAFSKIILNWNDLSTYSGFLDLKVPVMVLFASLVFFVLRTKHWRRMPRWPMPTKPIKILLLLFALQFFFCAGVLLQLNGIFLRYAHPLFPINVFGMGLICLVLAKTVSSLNLRKVELKWISILLALSFSWFTVRHYHNFLYQFASQHRARTAEKLILNRLHSLIGNEGTLLVLGSTEHASKIDSYFASYLPYFYSAHTSSIFCETLAACPVLDSLPQKVQFAISMTEGKPRGFDHFERIYSPFFYRTLHIVHKFSRLMNSGRRIERWNDSGSPDIEYFAWWDIYKRSPVR